MDYGFSMNRFLFIRNSLIEIYNRRNILLENLTKEVDKYDTSKKNYGESYYNHVKLLLTEIELNLKNAIPRGNNYLPYPPKDELIQTNFDFFMAVTGIDMTTIHSLGYFEPSETVLTQRITNYSQTLFDVGANLGYFSFLFNCFSQTDSKVYAFEPENYNFERLTKAVTINDQKERLSIFKIALSDLCSEELLYINRRGSGGHSLVKTQPEIFSERHEIISVYTLDDFLKENNIDGQDSFLKIDVEGAELKVLEGSLNFLSNKKPVAILCEIWAEDKTKSNTHLDIISKIVDFGYSGYSVQIPSFGSPLLKPIFFENKFNQSYNDNYLFIRSDRIDIIKSCLEPLKWFELVSNQGLEDLLDIQEKSLLSLIEYHTASVPMEKSKYYKHYISSSDGGYPLINNYDPRPVAAKIRFHHNCGGPAILTFVDKNTCDLVTSIVVGNSEKYKNDEGHYSVPHEEAARIVKEDIIKYKPDIVLLMPNNVTSFNKDELNKLRNVYKFFLAARDGDACSYDSERIEKNLQIAGSVDYFISVDGEFVELAESKGYSNVEYIPSFVNEHLVPNKTDIKIYDILFTGVGWVGEQMDNGETMYKRRRSFIRKVNEIYGNKFKVFGHAWDDLYLANWTNEFISEDYVHTYAGKTKIVIAFDGPYAKGFTSVRVFRALMSGAFVLIRYFPGIENIFENHKHLVWFHGDEEGLSAIDYYLNNDAERKQIAKNGRNYLLEKSGWRRSKIILNYLIMKSKGEHIRFGDFFGTYSIPIVYGNEVLNKAIKKLKQRFEIVNLLDIISLSESMIEEGNYQEAELILDAIIEFDENYLEALNDLTYLEIAQKNYEKALLYNIKSLSIDNEDEIAKINFNFLKGKLGETFEEKYFQTLEL